jgi:hypothetical protein
MRKIKTRKIFTRLKKPGMMKRQKLRSLSSRLQPKLNKKQTHLLRLPRPKRPKRLN